VTDTQIYVILVLMNGVVFGYIAGKLDKLNKRVSKLEEQKERIAK
jgi:hypothetical protein